MNNIKSEIIEHNARIIKKNHAATEHNYKQLQLPDLKNMPIAETMHD